MVAIMYTSTEFGEGSKSAPIEQTSARSGEGCLPLRDAAMCSSNVQEGEGVTPPERSNDDQGRV